MTNKEAQEYMENEIRCIQKSKYCDRNCAICEFVKKDMPLIEACGLALEALEKQIPKKPLDKQTPVITWAICPVCKGERNMLGGKANRIFESNEYCPDCGQRLDWSDTNG